MKSTINHSRIDPESHRLMIEAANLQKNVELTIHEYYLTLSPAPTLCTLTIKLPDGLEHSVTKSLKNTVAANELVGDIMNDYPVQPSVFCVQHYKRPALNGR